MDIQRITTQAQFDILCGWSKMRQFGSFADLPRTTDDDNDAGDDCFVAVAMIDGSAAGYINADMHGVWNVETQPQYCGQGIARALVVASGARFFCEVVSDAGAALADALGCDFEDCRG